MAAGGYRDEDQDEGGYGGFDRERGRGTRSWQSEGGPGGRFGASGFRPRRSVCSFCVDKVRVIDHKDVKALEPYLDSYAKIRAARKTGTCAKHQRRLAVAVKRARHMALIPFSSSRFRGE